MSALLKAASKPLARMAEELGDRNENVPPFVGVVHKLFRILEELKQPGPGEDSRETIAVFEALGVNNVPPPSVKSNAV